MIRGLTYHSISTGSAGLAGRDTVNLGVRFIPNDQHGLERTGTALTDKLKDLFEAKAEADGINADAICRGVVKQFDQAYNQDLGRTLNNLSAPADMNAYVEKIVKGCESRKYLIEFLLFMHELCPEDKALAHFAQAHRDFEVSCGRASE